MFCKKCGAELDNDAKFCKRCGESVQLIMDESIDEK